MTFSLRNIATAGLAAIVATPAFAMEAPANTAPAVAAAEAAATIATVLVMAMIVPGVALFYGGLARTKNMASVLTQVLCVSSLAMLIWVMYGYSMAFGDTGNAFIADFGKVFLKGVTADSGAATFSDGVEIPEYIFIAFQMTFAAITAALIVGGTMERAKLSTMMVFTAIWLTIVYFPIAHMVWATGGLIFEWGALDFAGGTVVHINAGVSALVGCLILGKATQAFDMKREDPRVVDQRRPVVGVGQHHHRLRVLHPRAVDLERAAVVGEHLLREERRPPVRHLHVRARQVEGHRAQPREHRVVVVEHLRVRHPLTQPGGVSPGKSGKR